MTKDQIRKIYLHKRMALDGAEYIRLNNLICHVFFSHVRLSDISLLHTYLPMERKKEPDTRRIIERVRRDFPHIRITVPRIDQQSGLLEQVLLESPEQLVVNAWGISEPQYGDVVPPENTDMVLIPLLALDEQGYRIGYGRGYYDRFLKRCRKDVPRIGISFFPPLASVPHDEYDIPLTACVTPDHYYVFNTEKTFTGV
jgi:5-formyltetrahydrofolate cyclo-ligase